jgi:hypothetical protein
MKYDYQYPLRMTADLKTEIYELANQLDINPSDYMRKTLQRNVEQDRQQLQSTDNHLVFLR